MTQIGAQFIEQLRDPAGSEDTEQLTAAIQRLAIQGQWTQIPYAASLFCASSAGGTWSPKASDVRLFQWCIIGRKMTVQFHIQNGPATGVLYSVLLRVPNTGYRTVLAPYASVPHVMGFDLAATDVCSIWQDTGVYGPGIAGPLNRTDGIVILCGLTANTQINTVANAGCFGSIEFAVQPAA